MPPSFQEALRLFSLIGEDELKMFDNPTTPRGFPLQFSLLLRLPHPMAKL